jgi:hypothetical protein
MTLLERVTRLPDGCELMESGVARDGYGYQASVQRTNEAVNFGVDACYGVDVCFQPEYFGAEPFKLRREFTKARYVVDFLTNL